MAIGGFIEVFVACDGEEILGDRYDGNACELTTENVVDMGDSDESRRRQMLVDAESEVLKDAKESGWRFRPDGHLCPICAAKATPT